MRPVLILVPRDGCFEIARIRQTIRPDRPEVGKTKLLSVIFTDIAAKLLIVRMRLDLELQPTRDADHFTGARLQVAQLSKKTDPPLFGDEQHFPVGVVKIAVAHAFVKGIDVDADADLRKQVTVTRDGRDAVNEICRFGWYRKWIPAKLIW